MTPSPIFRGRGGKKKGDNSSIEKEGIALRRSEGKGRDNSFIIEKRNEADQEKREERVRVPEKQVPRRWHRKKKSNGSTRHTVLEKKETHSSRGAINTPAGGGKEEGSSDHDRDRGLRSCDDEEKAVAPLRGTLSHARQAKIQNKEREPWFDRREGPAIAALSGLSRYPSTGREGGAKTSSSERHQPANKGGRVQLPAKVDRGPHVAKGPRERKDGLVFGEKVSKISPAFFRSKGGTAFYCAIEGEEGSKATCGKGGRSRPPDLCENSPNI